MLVLGLIGKRACGKNIFAEYIKDRYGFRLLDYTRDVLAPVLEGQGKQVTRENLATLAMGLRELHGEDILTRRLCRKVRRGQNIVISGIRFPAEVAYLRRAFGGCFKFIALEADAKLRYERARNRGAKGEKALSFREFIRLERLPTERIIPGTMRLADFSVANNKTPKDLYKRIDRIMDKLDVKPAEQ